ncbi:MAG: hypothetical protein KBS55_05085 [Bacteroidales bacterium]|nr:hypothetical protein [Candidatus Cryptobacteroides aphodequi]
MKTRKYFALAMICAMALASCKGPEEPASTASFKLDKTSVTLADGEAGSTDVIFTAKDVNPVATVAADAQDWLEASVSARALTLVYDRNETGAVRTGKVHIEAGSLPAVDFTLTQPAYVAPTDDDLKIGQVVGEGDAMGIIYWVDPSNRQNGKAVSVARTTGLTWGPMNDETGAISQVNGGENGKLLASADYAAAYWCSQMGEGWYLPAKSEMVEIFSVYNGVEASLATVAQPKGITDAEKQARAAFDQYLIDAGGEGMNTAAEDNNGQSYWTSTEYDGGAAWFVRFGKYNVAHDVDKSSTSRYVRCIKVIGEYSYPTEPVSLSVSPSSLSFEGEASSKEVTAKVAFGTLTGAEVDTEGADWCSASVNGNTITVTVTANATGASRRTAVYAKAESTSDAEPVTKEIVVEQATMGGFKIGDVIYEGETAVGVVFWVNDKADSAKIVALKRSGKIAWAVDGSVSGADVTEIGCDNPDYGKPNTDKIIEFVGANTDDIPWLSYINGLGDGWYFPAHNELKKLFEAYNGTTFGAASVKVYDSCTDAEKAARDAFNKALIDLGGDPIDDKSQANGDQYLSSDESKETLDNGTEVYSVRFGKVALNKDTAKTGTSRYVRAIKLIGK